MATDVLDDEDELTEEEKKKKGLVAPPQQGIPSLPAVGSGDVQDELHSGLEDTNSSPSLVAAPGQTMSSIAPPNITMAPTYPEGSSPSSATGQMVPDISPAKQRLQGLEEGQSGVSKMHGVGGGIVKGLDVAGSIFAPRAMTYIPGSSLNYQHQLDVARQNVAQDTAEQQREQQIVNEQAHQGLETAQTAETQARTAGLVNPPAPTNEFELWARQNPSAKVSDWLQLQSQNKPPQEGERPLTNVAQMNKALADRYQVLNPGKPLPGEFTIPPNATQKDYDRIDKALSGVEGAQGTKAQRDQIEILRQQAADAAAESRKDKEENEGLKWVTWNDPATGKQTAGPLSQAKKSGAMDTAADLPAQEVRDVQNARHAVRLMTKLGDPNKPETQGVLQLIDSLDADGKLGVLASRWNSLLTTGVGTSPDDDPRIIALIDKNMLGDTATMLAHFGASGGRSPQMLQHFLDLANARKMDGLTLRTGVKSIVDYMQDRAMMPTEGGAKGKGKVLVEGKDF